MTEEYDDQSTSMEEIDNMLPSNWKYKVIDKCYRKFNVMTLKVALFSPEEIKSWVKVLEENTYCTYSIRDTARCTGQRVLFKQRLHCHHNTRNTKIFDSASKNRTKNTKCPSLLNITLKAVSGKFRGDAKNAPDPEMPCLITFVTTHNHNVVCADALKFRKVTSNTKKKLIDLYNAGHTPVTALETLKIDIQLSNEDCELFLADRSICPDYNYCYHLFKTEFKKMYGHIDLEDKEKTFLIKKLKEYNEMIGEECAMFHIEEGAYVITLCPPLFKRIHENINSASEIVIIDATATADHEGSKIYILSTQTQCGDLPLGIIITSSESADNIALGFEMLKTMLDNIIFYRNPEGPLVFVIDDCEAEHIAIQSVWKKSRCLLRICNVLQSLYRWLVNSKNGIPKNCIMEFFEQFRLIVYATTIAECEQNYNVALKTAEQYGNYVEYLETYWQKREMWALSYRLLFLIRDNHFNLISEAAMRLLKEKILNRVKAFNIAQLVDFLLSRFVDYYEKRLLDAAYNRFIEDKLLNTIRLPSDDVIEKIQKIDETMYLVPSENAIDLHYIVYADVLICTCFHENTTTICNHIDWVHMLYHSDAYHRRIDNMEIRKNFFKIGAGEAAHQNWPLNELETACSSVEEEEDRVSESSHCLSLPDEVEFVEICSIPLHDEEFSKDIAEGQKLIKDLADCCTSFLMQSPDQVLPALKEMVDKSKEMTIDAFVSSCSAFSAEFHQTELDCTIPIQPTQIVRRLKRKVRGHPETDSKIRSKVSHTVSNKNK